jgi:hypothetical protein
MAEMTALRKWLTDLFDYPPLWLAYLFPVACGLAIFGVLVLLGHFGVYVPDSGEPCTAARVRNGLC